MGNTVFVNKFIINDKVIVVLDVHYFIARSGAGYESY